MMLSVSEILGHSGPSDKRSVRDGRFLGAERRCVGAARVRGEIATRDERQPDENGHATQAGRDRRESMGAHCGLNRYPRDGGGRRGHAQRHGPFRVMLIKHTVLVRRKGSSTIRS